MTEYSAYYRENLYPIQNKILNVLQSLKLPFYLTGGTALSRGFYNHRFSDDLDFFVNSDDQFFEHTQLAITAIEKNSFTVQKDKNFASADFVRISVTDNSKNISGMKMDFVNDIPVHYGTIIPTPVYYRTDSIYNILTNKYTALYRISVKDVVDIREICLHEKFDWNKIIEDADRKENGVDLKEVTDIFLSFSDMALINVKWINMPSLQQVRSDFETIARDMLLRQKNTLFNN